MIIKDGKLTLMKYDLNKLLKNLKNYASMDK